MGLLPKDFYEMRLRDFFLKMHGFRLEQEARSRESADLVRLQTMELININLKKEDKIKDPVKFWRFSWEEEPEKASTNEQQAADRLQKLLKSL